ncbi:hypothetical protein Hdeb2414_s0003g00100261 [Helianthus debilis subsp. tardiflorus]
MHLKQLFLCDRRFLCDWRFLCNQNLLVRPYKFNLVRSKSIIIFFRVDFRSFPKLRFTINNLQQIVVHHSNHHRLHPKSLSDLHRIIFHHN